MCRLSLVLRRPSPANARAPKVLVFAGSIRSGSYNARLAAVATRELMLAEADVTLISLADYAMPLYDANLEAASGPPENAFRLKRLMCAQDGVFIASPEYNACCGALVIPEQVAVREAASAFDEMDQLKDERTVRLLKSVVNRLVDMARGFA